MAWLRKRKAVRAEVEHRIEENLKEAQEVRKAREREAALTPAIRKEAQWMVNRGKLNRYGESLMLAWELKTRHGHG